jgi:hypothetical protein
LQFFQQGVSLLFSDFFQQTVQAPILFLQYIMNA